MPLHCIDCDKIAVVLDNTVPYCPSCYRKEQASKEVPSLVEECS